MGSSTKRHKSDKSQKKKRHRSRSRSKSISFSPEVREQKKKQRHRSRSRSDSIISLSPDIVKESKRKRHRSRSRSKSVSLSPEILREKHRHHKKHKKKDRKDYDSDVEIIDAPPPPKISKLSQSSSTAHRRKTPPPPEISRKSSPPPPPTAGNQEKLSLSIDETNRLRAKLGLKPLEVGAEKSKSKDTNHKEGGKKEELPFYKDDLGEFHHKPAVSITQKSESDKYREKLSTYKEKRLIDQKLNTVKTLGESDSEEDAASWIKKTKKIEIEKKKAQERAKMLDQMDEEFGIDNLVKDEVRKERRKAYTSKHLKGLRVEHELDSFTEDSMTILTLKDQEVLAEDGDALQNVNMVDNERYKKNVQIKSKKPGYDAFDEENYDEFGFPSSSILKKYDEEIDGQKKQSFAIGMVNPAEMKRRQAELVAQRMANKRIETLQLPDLKLASDYYNEEEMTKFKKTKKKVRKIRKSKVLKADDLLADGAAENFRDLGSRRPKAENRDLETDDFEVPKEDLSGVKIEDDWDLEKQIKQKTQRLKKPVSLPKPEAIASRIKREVSNDNSDDDHNSHDKSRITLNSMAEFCRTLGDIPTYGHSGNREDRPDFRDFDMEYANPNEMTLDEKDADFLEGRGTWNQVKLDHSNTEPVPLEAAILDAEPSLDQGVGGALKLALSKGYLQREESGRPGASRLSHLAAQNYSIEDKSYNDDEKFSRRDRFNGPISAFSEKEYYKPNVKLEYIDDDGHLLNSKEAFRYLSHKFHGKGPGKNKVEKRMKKAEQESLMKKMSSTDTPLGTLNLLQAKQKDTQSPFIVLSGSKHLTSSISKSKH